MDFQLHLQTETIDHLELAAPVVVAPGDSVARVLEVLAAERTGAAVVVERGQLLGIFTERDALKLMADGADLHQPVSVPMTKHPVTLRQTDTLARAISLMAGGGFRRLPVLDPSGKLLGILKVSRIMHYLVDHFPRVIYNLPPTPHHKPASREGA
nr:CBS domain-containing protein [Pirellula staleyi]